jgi:hypothetical protein
MAYQRDCTDYSFSIPDSVVHMTNVYSNTQGVATSNSNRVIPAYADGTVAQINSEGAMIPGGTNYQVTNGGQSQPSSQDNPSEEPTEQPSEEPAEEPSQEVIEDPEDLDSIPTDDVSE